MPDFTRVGGPYGDATSDYRVGVKNGMTVKDLCREILKSDDHGSVHIGSFAGPRIMTYSRGSFDIPDQAVFDSYANMIVKGSYSNGDWGLMDYVIQV